MPIADTSHLHIEFYSGVREDKAKSRDAGRPIYEDVEMVKLIPIADRGATELHAPAGDKYRFDRELQRYVSYAEDFPRHYEAFKSGMEKQGSGTPIEELPFLTAARKAELKAMHIHTAEGLAGLEGPGLQNLGPGARAMKTQAQAYIDKAAENAPMMKFAEENEDLRTQIAELQAQMAGMRAGWLERRPADDGASPPEDLPALPQAQAQPMSQFEEWPDAELRNYIKEKTGTAPRGQPAHATLVSMAEDAAQAVPAI